MRKLGLVAPYGAGVTPSDIVGIAQMAEELGYDSIWIPEMWGRDAFSILGLIACNTSSIKLGTGIISVFSRTPAIIAQTVATLDEISGGRMMLGLGSSGPIVIEDWHGLKFEKQLQRTKDYVEIIRMILRFERVNYKSEIFDLKNFRLQFKPLRSKLPIFIAAIGPKNSKLAGELADGWIPFLIPLERLAGAREQVSSASNNVIVSPFIIASVTDDPALSKRQVSEHLVYYVGGMGTYYGNVLRRFGYGEEVENITSAWNKGSKAEAIEAVSDRMLSSLTLSGSIEQARARLSAYYEAGADLPILIFPPKSSIENVTDTINALAPSS